MLAAVGLLLAGGPARGLPPEEGAAGAWIALDTATVLGGGERSAADAEPRAATVLRVRYQSPFLSAARPQPPVSGGRPGPEATGGPGEGHDVGDPGGPPGAAPPPGAAWWRFGLGAHAVHGWAPHKPGRAGDPGDPWVPEAAGLCEPRPGTACPEVRLYPEIWAEWLAPGAWGDGGSLELWAGWRPVPPGPLPGSELSSSRRAPPAPGWGGAADFGRAARYERWMMRLQGGDDRYLVGHRMRLNPDPAVTLWVYEIGILTGRFLSQPFTWLPFWPMYLTQHLALRSGALSAGNDDANLHIGVAARVAPGPRGLELAGELFVDDMQQPFKQTPQPDQIGLALSASWSPAPAAGSGKRPARAGEGRSEPRDGSAGPGETAAGPGEDLAGSLGRVELAYQRVHRFVYTFQNPRLSYLHAGLALGDPDGPDSDRLILRWTRPGRSPATLGIEWRRRGPGRLGEAWERALTGAEARALQFLGGTVEHALLGHVGWDAFPSADPLPGGKGGPPAWRVHLAAGPVIGAAGQPGRVEWLLQVLVQVHLL